MFELEDSISEWKQSFRLNGSFSQERIDELESHLRESIVELSRKGLSAEESFVIAMKRLGHAPNLAVEFVKNSPMGMNQDRVIWMLCGYLGISICGMMHSVLVSSSLTGMAYARLGGTASGVVTILVQFLLWIAVAVLLWRAKEVVVAFANYPGIALAGIFVAMVALPIVKSLCNMAQARIADPKWLVETYHWTGIGNFLVQMVIYAFCFIVLYQYRRSRKNVPQSH